MDVTSKVRELVEEAPREQLDLRDLVVKIWGNPNSKYYKVLKDKLHEAFPDIVIRKAVRKYEGAAGMG